MKYVVEYHMKTGGKVDRAFDNQTDHERAVQDYRTMRSGIIEFGEVQTVTIGEKEVDVGIDILIPYDSVTAIRAYAVPEKEDIEE